MCRGLLVCVFSFDFVAFWCWFCCVLGVGVGFVLLFVVGCVVVVRDVRVLSCGFGLVCCVSFVSFRFMLFCVVVVCLCCCLLCVWFVGGVV